MPAQDPLYARSCVVCGVNDARALSTTSLADGTRVPVCGSHELSHRRSGATARTVEELRGLTLERRRRSDRRAASGDALGLLLTEAFSPKGRRATERRSGQSSN